ncbi:hypothetical protein SAMN05216371_0132 [Streptomyces sp. TLI_053]|nr:hypothetical protein SAMN05216371_0132 [Streptomyces sp. TLI_053]
MPLFTLLTAAAVAGSLAGLVRVSRAHRTLPVPPLPRCLRTARDAPSPSTSSWNFFCRTGSSGAAVPCWRPAIARSEPRRGPGELLVAATAVQGPNTLLGDRPGITTTSLAAAARPAAVFTQPRRHLVPATRYRRSSSSC